MNLTKDEILAISVNHGTMNDFGKTFFTDDELVEFAREVYLEECRKEAKAMKISMVASSEINGIEW